MPCRNWGAVREKKALTKPSAATFRSVTWVLSAHTAQMGSHNSFESTEILPAIISPRVFPGQIPTNARVSKTNSFAHGPWKTVEKHDTGVKWPGRRLYWIKVAEHKINPTAQGTGCSAPFLLHLVIVSVRGMIMFIGLAPLFLKLQATHCGLRLAITTLLCWLIFTT